MLLNHQDDQSQLIEYISFMDSMLTNCHRTRKDETLTQDDKALKYGMSVNGNNDSIKNQWGALTLDQELQNYSKEYLMEEHDSREAKKFEDFIQEEAIRQDLKHLWEESLKVQNNIKRPKYIEKHSGPLHAFTYHGITLSAKYCNFNNEKATAIIIPFDEAKAADFSKIFNHNPLSFYFLKKLEKIQLETGRLKCYPITVVNKFNNHKWVYFFKKPQKNCLKKVSLFYLGLMLREVLKTSIRYKSQNIIFPFFEWPRLSSQQKATQIFTTITNYLSKRVREQKLNLKQITLCSDNPNDYLALSEELKKISDAYIKCGIVAL